MKSENDRESCVRLACLFKSCVVERIYEYGVLCTFVLMSTLYIKLTIVHIINIDLFKSSSHICHLYQFLYAVYV